jgi:single-strand DNA-binding protein
MNETVVTLQGWLGGEVTLRAAGETPVASFRVACTPRRYQRRTDSWVDGDTQWYTVTAWRALADNCARSLRSGDPVVVHGRLNAQTWTSSAGIEVTSFEVEAAFVGHDLNRGVGRFTRAVRTAAEEPQDSAVLEPQDPVAEEPPDPAAEAGGAVAEGAPPGADDAATEGGGATSRERGRRAGRAA